MARRVLRLAYWFAVAAAATTVATLVIAYSVGARPTLKSSDDIARYLAGSDPVADPSSRPASPGTARGGVGHAGGTSGAAGVPGGTAPDPASAAPGTDGTTGTTPAGTGTGTGSGSTPGGSTNPAPTTPASESKVLFSSGGSVVASCSGSTVTLETWTPKSGFRPEDASPGPGSQASVEFKSDTAGNYLVVVTCSNGTPTLSEQVLADHGGGGPGRGGPGGGGG